MNLEPIADYLAVNGLGTKGTDLFYQEMPASTEEGTLVTSKTPILNHPYQIGRRDGTLQIIVRGANHDDIRTKAEAISVLLHAEGLDLTEYKLLQITPQQEPLILPLENSTLLEATVNFNITYI